MKVVKAKVAEKKRSDAFMVSRQEIVEGKSRGASSYWRETKLYSNSCEGKAQDALLAYHEEMERIPAQVVRPLIGGRIRRILPPQANCRFPYTLCLCSGGRYRSAYGRAVRSTGQGPVANPPSR